jgi:hypothetical protein
MNQSRFQRYEVDGESLIEAINHLQISGPGEPPVTCQACAKHLPDGARATAYAVRSPKQGWQVAQTRCRAHPPCLSTLATLGLEEYLLTGRLGRVVDTAHQRAYPILRNPTPTAHSPPEATA